MAAAVETAIKMVLAVHKLFLCNCFVEIQQRRATPRVYAASCVGVAPSGKFGGISFLPVAISAGFSQPSAMRLLLFVRSKLSYSATSSEWRAAERRDETHK